MDWLDCMPEHALGKSEHTVRTQLGVVVIYRTLIAERPVVVVKNEYWVFPLKRKVCGCVLLAAALSGSHFFPQHERNRNTLKRKQKTKTKTN
jgi:hypothetical protein